MYVYDEHDRRMVKERAAQFLSQVQRRLDGRMTEEQFKPLRLQNGLYMQLHSYMLRVAIPYGALSSTQLRRLAQVSEQYDRGYGHFTTRQNIQFNWSDLRDVPRILEALAEVGMHAIQSSGNCIRNITADPFAGVSADEDVDPRPICELLRQWSTFHPEFAALPRKFKLAVTGASTDRAAIELHDIGYRLHRQNGDIVVDVYVGGGQGRTPVVAKLIRSALPLTDLVSYTDAILRVYNRMGRRDNKYKARIKILVSSLGIDEFRREVDAEWASMDKTALDVRQSDIEGYIARFTKQTYEPSSRAMTDLDGERLLDPQFADWLDGNVATHRVSGYAIATISLKATGRPPGDATAFQMSEIADLADAFSQGRIVVTHRQNLVLPDVKIDDLFGLWKQLGRLGLAKGNVGSVTDTICCPGLDYCNLANARSINIAQEIEAEFEAMRQSVDLGPLHLNISGCINACGHHHVGQIGVLGINKLGVEYYQIMLGGSSGRDARLGKILGRAFPKDQIVPAIKTILTTYINLRLSSAETFLASYQRVGPEPFKEAVYENNTQETPKTGQLDKALAS